LHIEYTAKKMPKYPTRLYPETYNKNTDVLKKRSYINVVNYILE